MMGLVLLLSGSALLGGAATWWLGRRLDDSGTAPPVSTPVGDIRDRLPESGHGDGENGLAAFYAYQMAAGKIDRSR